MHEDDPPPAPDLMRAIRRRLMERVADAEATHHTVAAGAGHWQPLGPGVAIKVLAGHGAVASYLLRLAPGATLPPHRHAADEECVVLEGRVSVGRRLEIGPGGYHLAHRGALHATLSSHTGALLFLRGPLPDPAQVLA